MSLVDKLQDYIGAVKTDFPASMAMLDENVQWINLLPEHVPFGGEYRGHEGIVEYFQQMSESFVIGDYIYDEFEFIETGNTVVLVGYEKNATVPATGKTFDLHFVWVVKFNEDGKICYLREHNDTAAIGDAFRA
jgi:ketosteroid isomerase-like protein